MSPPAFLEEGREYLVLLHRRRLVVLACVVAALLVAVLHNATARPVYEATAQLLIERQAPRVLNAVTEADSEPGTADYYETQYELLRGRALAERVLPRLGADRSEELLAGPLLSPWSRLRAAMPSGADRPAPAADLVSTFRSRITVEPLAGSRLVNVRFRAYDASFATRAVNTLADAYVEQALELQFTRSQQATDWLDARIGEQGHRLKQAEQALLAFKEKKAMVGPGSGRSLADQQLGSLNAAYLAARSDRLAREVVVESLRGLSPAELDAVPAVVDNPVVQGLKIRVAELRDEERRLQETLGERHPDLLAVAARREALQADLETEAANIRKALEAGYQTALLQETRMEEELHRVKAATLAYDRSSLDGATLAREVDSRRELLKELQGRSQQTGLESQLRFTNLRLMERAQEPREPILPRRSRNTQVALVLGLAIGAGLALLLGYLDDSVKTPDDVSQLLGLPFLGMVPDVSRDADKPGPALPVCARDPQSAVAEAYRVVRTALLFAGPASGGRAFVVSSANPGEGKTTTLANLAVSLAQNGAKVLAVDADLRRPTLIGHFGLEPGPGLAEVLGGEAAVDTALRATEVPNLKVMGSGKVPENPAELVGSDAFRSFLEAQRRAFDWVLIDAPPVLAMADAPVLSSLADGVVMVVWSEHCSRPALKRALEQVRVVEARLAGVVLNKVDLRRNAYYYGQYYGEYYRRYYAEGEAAALAR
jgi:capsular exopolysaccharide synthesis family protein